MNVIELLIFIGTVFLVIEKLLDKKKQKKEKQKVDDFEESINGVRY